MARKLKITQVKSGIGRTLRQKATVRALGFRCPGQTVVRDETPSVRGMIRHVEHLVTVVETDGDK